VNRHGRRIRPGLRPIGVVRTRLLASITLILVVAACGAGESLSHDEKAWCLGNADKVESAAKDLGLLGFVGVYYETEGDGLGSDGQPVMTDRNIAATEALRSRTAVNTGVALHHLFSRYLTHPDGQIACGAASAAENA
jgi:hypothetical protein